MKKLATVLSIALVLVLGYFIGFYVRAGAPWSENASIFFIILASGAFGGLLYTARDSGLDLLHRDPENQYKINLGWVADCAYGIAGALVVFLVVPTELNFGGEGAETTIVEDSIMNLIKLIALALVGGYGGRKLIDEALSNIAKKAEEAIESAKETKEKMNQIQEVDTKALELVNLQLDANESVDDIQSLKNSIKAASKAARFEIFKEARSIRRESWKNNKPLMMERTIPIFEALIENEAGEEYHRNHAQLAYALKDKREPEWERAYNELTKAINVRNKNGKSGFLMYEFNRAICGVKLDKDPESIQSDLESAAKSDFIHEIMQKEEVIKNWAKKNQYNLDKLESTDGQ